MVINLSPWCIVYTNIYSMIISFYVTYSSINIIINDIIIYHLYNNI